MDIREEANKEMQAIYLEYMQKEKKVFDELKKNPNFTYRLDGKNTELTRLDNECKAKIFQLQKKYKNKIK